MEMVCKLTSACLRPDAGDCGFGFCANSLQLGCDCVGAISYLDGVLNDVNGERLGSMPCLRFAMRLNRKLQTVP